MTHFVVFRRLDSWIKLFKDKSKFCNDISFYNEFNPDYKFVIQKSISLKQHVSLESKTPNLLYELLGKDINIIRNLDEDDDIDILIESLNLRDNIENNMFFEYLHVLYSIK